MYQRKCIDNMALSMNLCARPTLISTKLTDKRKLTLLTSDTYKRKLTLKLTHTALLARTLASSRHLHVFQKRKRGEITVYIRLQYY